MRDLIRSLTPNVLLSIYRPLRNRSRHFFSRFFDYRNSHRLKKQIIYRYPELGNQSRKGVVLDVGANVGDFTDACLDLGFSVVAVEPHPDALAYLQHRMRKKPNVEILAVGLSNISGKSFLYTHPDHTKDPIATSISASTISEKFNHEATRFEIKLMTLEQILNDNHEFEIVKIDIEGAEMLLIDSIIHNAPKIKKLLLETHERFMLNTKNSEQYRVSLNKLNVFIQENNLGKDWLTDWI